MAILSLCAVMALSFVFALVAPKMSIAIAQENEVVTISNLQQLKDFRDLVNDGNNYQDKTIKLAADIAQATEFIESKKDGFDEYVEEKGTSLSGGQKQRLSIARAIVKKPEILIFDDSSSALDLVTEAKLYKAMREHINDTTRIVVAQRVATAKNADKIIVLDGGVIVDFDTHENLLASCEVYQDIYNSQLKREGDSNE
jgi:ABC-type multidrug transport system fused ATPase/permease subunit